MQDIVIVGGGSAGLATGALLRRAGIEPLIVEAAPSRAPRGASGTTGSTCTRRACSPASRAGASRAASGAGSARRRDRVLREYADGEGLMRTGVRVERIERDGERWRLDTGGGTICARDVIVAGVQRPAVRAGLAGPPSFTGRFVHSADYRNPQPYTGNDVLVIGPGNSGSEIATDIAEGGASRTRLSVRTPPQIIRRATAGIPAQLIGIAIPGSPVVGRSDLEGAAASFDSRSIGPGPAAAGDRRPHVDSSRRHDSGARRRDGGRSAARAR